MAQRIAVVRKEKCNPQGCGGYLCMKVNPDNRMGVESIYIDADKKVAINEELCGPGISIAVNKCPFDALAVVNLPAALDKEPLYRYSKNGFALFNVPVPRFGAVTGLIGRNGIGKSTAVRLLAGLLKPNLGNEEEADKDAIIRYFKGTEAHGYFDKVYAGQVTVAYKPQQVELIPKQYQGTVQDLLRKVDERDAFDTVVAALELSEVLDHDITQVSGGELQRVAIAATALRKANVYFFDEPTSYLDIKQRLKMAHFIRSLANADTAVMVVEHDLIILDAMTDFIHILYGQEGVYGVVSQVKATKAGINTYLSGYLREENIKFRDQAIRFEHHAKAEQKRDNVLTTWQPLDIRLGSFTLKSSTGEIYAEQVMGILGPNGIGKTTFVQALSQQSLPVTLSLKTQYLEPADETVQTFLQEAIEHLYNQLVTPLAIEPLYQKNLTELSGGELQRVMIAKCLSQKADLYLLDEPSAYLDVEQRLKVSRLITDFMFQQGKSAMVVDHDLLFIDTLAEKLLVFEGQPAHHGLVQGPFTMEEGMNHFLKDLGITFRRDEENARPRTNKQGSQKDREQKASGRLYYT